MHYYLLKLIVIIHVIFLLFLFIVPFTNSNYLLLIHVIIVPFIMIHWLLNDNTCALTLMEKYVRQQMNGTEVEVKDEDCFTCRIIDPIYKFTDNYSNTSWIAYIVLTILWLIALSKLIYKFKIGEITSLYDLAKV